MRKPTKSSLGLLLNLFSKQSNVPEILSLFKMVVAYSTLKHYGAHLTVVFDGYGSATSTKVAEQRRIAHICTSLFDGNILYANKHNPKQLSLPTATIR